MKPVRLFSRQLCGWCQEARTYLQDHKIPFEYIDVGHNREAYDEMIRLSGQRYVPTIEVEGQVLADFDVQQLEKFLQKLNVPLNNKPK